MADDDDDTTTTTAARGKRRKFLLDANVGPALIEAGVERQGALLTNVPLRFSWRTTRPRRSRDWMLAEHLTPRPRNLKQWLRANCLTQKMFARKAGCSQGMVSQLEQGKRAARPRLAARIEQITGLSHDLFLDLGQKKRKRGPPGRDGSGT
jgi:hypothetical protein